METVMIIKTSSTLTTADETPIARHQANVSTLEWPIESDHLLTSHEQVVPLDLGAYQGASFSFPTREDENSPQASSRGRLFLVPLTSRHFNAQMRRDMAHASVTDESHVVRFGQVRIDLLAMDVWRSDRPVRLTAMEFKVLKFFVSNPNRVVSRDDMLNQVWGYENYPCTRTVDNQVLKLRQKLEGEAGHPVHFRTVYGVGYKFIP
jgi:Transcriptional regulatory protein, C terminal